MSAAFIVLALAQLTLTQSHPSAATASRAAASSAPRASNATSAHLAPPPHFQPNGNGSSGQTHGSQPAAPTHHAEGVASGNAHPAAPSTKATTADTTTAVARARPPPRRRSKARTSRAA